MAVLEASRTGEGAGGVGHRPLVSVLVVNYNAGALLSECVEAALASSLPVEVLVGDNGSADGSMEQLERALGADTRLRLRLNGANLGFAKASNRLLREATGDYLLFLNPDCIVGLDVIGRLYQVMENAPRAGMAGCLIVNGDGTEQAGCRREIPTPWRSLVHVSGLWRLSRDAPRWRGFVMAGRPLPAQVVEVEAISGALMFVRRSAVEAVGVLDEGYFMHCEDLDWCMRFRQHGWSVLFVPDVSAVHHKGTCSSGRPIRVLWHMHAGMLRFYGKFFRHTYPWPLMLLVRVAVWGRFSLLSVRAALRRARL